MVRLLALRVAKGFVYRYLLFKAYTSSHVTLRGLAFFQQFVHQVLKLTAGMYAALQKNGGISSVLSVSTIVGTRLPVTSLVQLPLLNAIRASMEKSIVSTSDAGNLNSRDASRFA